MLSIIGIVMASVLGGFLQYGGEIRVLIQPSEFQIIWGAGFGKEIAKLPNNSIIEGHTDSRPFRGRRNYSNWELSVDRANSARRLLQVNGVIDDRIVGVLGFADVQLRKTDDPEHPSNRRVSLIVKYDNQQLPGPDESSARGGERDFIDDGQDEDPSGSRPDTAAAGPRAAEAGG